MEKDGTMYGMLGQRACSACDWKAWTVSVRAHQVPVEKHKRHHSWIASTKSARVNKRMPRTEFSCTLYVGSHEHAGHLLHRSACHVPHCTLRRTWRLSKSSRHAPPQVGSGNQRSHNFAWPD
eukprot:1154474-Pelagomonas_calceolata.AAC.2